MNSHNMLVVSMQVMLKMLFHISVVRIHHIIEEEKRKKK